MKRGIGIYIPICMIVGKKEKIKQKGRGGGDSLGERTELVKEREKGAFLGNPDERKRERKFQESETYTEEYVSEC